MVKRLILNEMEDETRRIGDFLESENDVKKMGTSEMLAEEF